MKKFLVVLAILAIACVSVTGALAVVPHVHGQDFKHSEHKTCPVYQMGLGNIQADLTQTLTFYFALIACFLIFISSSFNYKHFFCSLFLRGPPAVFL